MTKMPFVCKANTPWIPSMGTPVVHVDAHEVSDQRDGCPSGDIVTYECPHCGHRWQAELPQ
jgi:hypothetical protein